MRLASTFLAGTAAAAMAAGAALAQEPPRVTAPPPPATAPILPPPAIAVFDFGGVYFGAYGGRIAGSAMMGALAGFNFVNGNFLAGVEGRLGVALAEPAALNVEVNARSGFILGRRFLPYVVAGAGRDFGAAVNYYTFGAGLEVGLGASLSVFAEGRGRGFGGTSNCCVGVFLAGFAWHR
jgi:opacity protein-like surface antigen